MPAAQMFTKIVAYYRLSKPKRGKNKSETIRDAYGLEDQRREVAKIAAKHDATIIGEFQEIETGTRKVHRKELDKAIAMCRMHKAVLVIGKQDRLARNVAFIANLMEAGIEFICADRPQQSKLETHFRSIIDEEEADRISKRTKAAMAVAREKGIKLGSARPGHWDGREHLRGNKQATIASSLARTERAKEQYRYLFPTICELNEAGMPLTKIAEHLNELGHVTTAGKPFHRIILVRIFKLFGKKPKPEVFVTGECSKCGRKFRVSWDQQTAKKQSGEPYICYRCMKEL